jgi:acyl dehydratase
VGVRDGGTHQFGRFLDDFTVGDVYQHYPGKTITEAECHLFSLLTMNHHPLHIDHEYAKGSQHGEVVVVGTLVFAVAVGQTVRDVSGRAIANLEYSEIRHRAPVFIGDTITSETTVLSVVTSRSKDDRGVVEVETRTKNQKGDVVLSFRRKVLVPRR